MNIEKMSLPTRHYLLEYILPNITEGLVEVAKRRPENPVEFLAKFLLEQGNQAVVADSDLDQEVVDEFQKLIASSKENSD